MHSLPLVYRSHASLYDNIVEFKDYAAECRVLRAVLQAEGIGDGARLLEAAVGTGNFMVHLREWYQVEGFDVSPPMLALARTRLPDARIFEADYRTVALEPRFDAVVCLYGSIGYLTDQEELRRTCAALARGLRPGGVLVMEPWLEPGDFEPGELMLRTGGDDSVKVARVGISRLEAGCSVYEFHWLVARTGTGVEYFVEEHHFGLFTHEQTRAALEAAGLVPRLIPEGLDTGHAVWVARKPASTD